MPASSLNPLPVATPARPESFWPGWRAWSLTVLACGLAWAGIFLLPTGPLQAVDFVGILQPYQDFLRSSLLSGELPLWNPYAGLGRPFLGDPQAVVLWPGTLCYVILGAPLGAWTLLTLHAAWAIVATAGIARRFGAANWAAWGAGWCFVFSPKLLGHAHAGHVQYVIAFLTLPAVIAAFLALRDEMRPGTIARFALVAAWQLLEGAPQVFWCTGMLVALLGTGFFAAKPSLLAGRTLLRSAAGAAAGYAWGFALAAISLLPAMELIGQSNREGKLAALSAVGPISLQTLPSLYTFLANPGQMWDYELMIFPGVLLAVVGVAGLALWRVGKMGALAFATVAVALLAVAPGTEWHAWLVQWLPGYGSFRFHSRWGIGLGWLLALSTAVFVSTREATGLRRIALGLSGLFAFGLLSVLYPSMLLDRDEPRADWMVLPLGYVVFALMAGWWATRGSAGERARDQLKLVLITLVAAELLVVLFFYKNGYPQDRPRPLEREIVPALSATGLLHPTQPPPRAYLPIRVAHNNAGMQLHYTSLFGYESLALARVRSVAHWTMGVEPPDDTDYPAHAHLDQRLPWPVRGFGLQLGYDLATKSLVTQPTPDLPRAWLAGSAVVEPDWRRAGRKIAAESMTAGGTAILEKSDPRISTLRSDAAGKVAFTAFALNRVTVTTHSNQPQLLVLAEPWYPGWRALVDGAAEECLPVNGWMRAVFVPAGAHVVEFRFRSRWLGLGAIVSLLALGAAALCLKRDRRLAVVADPLHS